MKKLALFIMLILSVLTLFGCKEKINDDEKNENSNKYVNYSVEQLTKINESLLNDKDNLLYPNMLQHTTNNGVANLWDFSAYFTGVIRTYKINKTDKIKVYFDKALKDLEWYRSTNRKDSYLVYTSDNGNEAEAFYDDNVWLVIGLLDAYEVTKEESLLEKAEAVQKWIYDSWQTSFGGGLLWREFEKGKDPSEISRNTCINAPAAYAAARFYQLTNSSKHLEWAKRIFTWTKEYLFNSQLNVYNDNINQLGVVSPMIFTYNTGVMISAASLLYDITKEEHYEEHAVLLVESAQQIMSKPHINKTIEGDFYKDNTWFNLYLFQGYLDATRYLKNTELAHKNMQKAMQAFDFSYPKYKDRFGLALEKWDATGYTQSQKDDFSAATLYASGNLESMGIFAEYVNENNDLFKK